MNPLIKIVPPLWMTALIVAGIVTHLYVPSLRAFDIVVPTVSTIVAVALLMLGQILILRSSYLFAREKTEILPASEKNSALVTEGPYRFTRNPMYLGLVASVLGFAVYFGTLPLFVSAVVLFLILNTLFIPFEEAKMRRQFGAEYDAYVARVRRWI